MTASSATLGEVRGRGALLSTLAILVAAAACATGEVVDDPEARRAATLARTFDDADAAPIAELVFVEADGEERHLHLVEQGVQRAVLLTVLDAADPGRRIAWSTIDATGPRAAVFGEAAVADSTWLFGWVEDPAIASLRVLGLDGRWRTFAVASPGFAHKVSGELNVQAFEFLDGRGRIVLSNAG